MHSIPKLRFALPILLSSAFLMAADSRGCTAETTDDGSSRSWETGPVPTPAVTAQPMSCEWLDSDNCWKQHVRKAVEATQGLEEGAMAEPRDECTYEGGGRWELGGPISTPEPGHILFPVTNWRFVDADGTARVTGKITGLGEHVLDVDGEVALFENPTLLTYRVTCPDGSTYANDVEGVCPEFGTRWVAREAPGVLMSCDGDSATCDLALWGGDDGEAVLSTCAW